MVDLINFNETKKIDFGSMRDVYPPFQQSREQDLQMRAGLEPSGAYEEVRQMLARGQEETALSELYTASERALETGAAPQQVVDFIQKYAPDVTKDDVDIALEKQAATKQIEDSFATNEKTYINNAVEGRDPTGDMAKQELYTTFINNLRGWAQSRSVAKKVGGFVRTMFDPQFHQNAVERDYFVNGKGFFKTAEGATKEVTDILLLNWRNMSEKDFKAYLDTTYNSIIQQNPNTWMLEEMCDNLEMGSTNLQEFMGWADVATVAVASVKNGFKAAKAVGDATKMKAIAKDAVAKLDTKQIVEEMVTPTATKPLQSAAEVSGTAAVDDVLAEAFSENRAAAIIQKARTQGVYSQDELNIMAEVEKELTANTFKRQNIDPVDISVVEDRDGVLHTITLFGSEDGSAMTRQQAINLAERLGYNSDEFSVVSKDAAGYYVQVTKETSGSLLDARLSMTGPRKEFTDEWSVKLSPIWRKTKVESILNGVTRHFAGVFKVGREAAERDVVATRVQGAIKNFMEKELKSSFNKLDKEGHAIFRELYLKGQKANNGIGKWFTLDELREANIRDDVIKAYADFKIASDMEYLTLNEKTRKQLVRAGYKQYGDVIGQEVSIKGINKNGIRVIDSDGNVVEDVMKYADDSNYKLVQVSRVSANQADLDCTHMLIKAADTPAEELPQFVVKYAPGGRRAYTRGTSFVKVGRGWFNPETSTKLNGFAKTLVAGYDKKQLQAYADEVNQAIEIYTSAMRSGDVNVAGAIAQAGLDKANFKYFKVSSWDELKDLIRSKDNPRGLIDPDFKAQVVDEGYSYAYNNGLENAASVYSEVDMSLQELIDTRMNFSRHRTNLLDDVNGDTVRLVDVEDIYDRTIRKTAAIGAKSDLTTWYARQLERFKSVTTNYSHLAGLSDADKLNRIEFDTARRARMSQEELQLLRSGQRFVEHARGILNSKTKADQAMDAFMTRTAEALDIFDRRGKWFDAVASFRPARAARALMFNAYMGWWNPAQLIKQGLGVMNVASLEPVRAGKAMLAYIPIRLARSAEAGSEQYRLYKQMAMKGAGLTDDEFEGLMKFMNKYDVEGSAGLMVGADREYGEALRRDKHLAKKIWDSQYWFMKEGNAANYYIADIASWLKHNDEVKKGVRKSFTDRDIALYSNDLFLNMTRTGESAFQRGTIVPGSEMLAQWMSYPMRMMEAFFNNRLTAKQKASLAFTQLALWGGAGTLGDDETSLNMYQGLVENDMDPEVAEVLTDGILGYVGHQLGVVFDEGVAVKEQFLKLLDFYDAARGELRWANISALKAPSYAIGLIKAIDEFVNPTLGDRDTYRYLKYLQAQPNLPSSLKNLSKGLLAMKTGKFFDKYGDILQDKATMSQSIWQILGFRPYESKLENFAYEAMTNREKVIEEAMEQLDEAVNVLRFHSYAKSTPEERRRLQEEFVIKKNGIFSMIDEIDDGFVKAEISKRLSEKITKMVRRKPNDREYEMDKNFTQHYKDTALRNYEEIRNGLHE